VPQFESRPSFLATAAVLQIETSKKDAQYRALRSIGDHIARVTLSCLVNFFTQHCSIAKSVGCSQRRCLCVCQHDNFRIRKHRMMKLGSRCIVQKSRPSSNLRVIAPVCTPPKMWCWATTLGKTVQAV